MPRKKKPNTKKKTTIRKKPLPVKKKVSKMRTKKVTHAKKKGHVVKKTKVPEPKVILPKKLTKKEIVRQEKVERLLQKGRERGFVTYDEILKEFPTVEEDVIFLEELYDGFEAEGIDVIESGGLLDFGGGASEEKNIYHRDENRYDSIQMYLRDIGKYDLISASQVRGGR